MDRARGTVIVAIVAALHTSSVVSCRRSEESTLFRSEGSPAAKTQSSATEPQSQPPVSFGYKGAWIAVKSIPKEKVATALGLKNPSSTA